MKRQGRERRHLVLIPPQPHLHLSLLNPTAENHKALGRAAQHHPPTPATDSPLSQ